MPLDSLRSAWALWAALLLALLAVMRIVVARYSTSAGGRLRKELKRLKSARKSRRAAEQGVTKASRRLAKLTDRSSDVKPRTLDEARNAMADAEQLATGARAQCMIAATRVGEIISEEFPPPQQQALRERYRLDDDFQEPSATT